MKLKIKINDSEKRIILDDIGIKRMTYILNTIIKSDKVTKNSRVLIINCSDNGYILSFEIMNENDTYPIHIGNYDTEDHKLFIFNDNQSNKIIIL